MKSTSKVEPLIKIPLINHLIVKLHWKKKNGMGKRVKSIDGDAREEQEVHDPGLVELASSCSLENSF